MAAEKNDVQAVVVDVSQEHQVRVEKVKKM